MEDYLLGKTLEVIKDDFFFRPCEPLLRISQPQVGNQQSKRKCSHSAGEYMSFGCGSRSVSQILIHSFYVFLP